MNRRKRSLVGAVATMVMALVAVVALPTPALAQTIMLSPSTGPAGTMVTVTGTCPGIPNVIIPDKATITMTGGVSMADTTLGAAGEYSVIITVPALAPGTYPVTVNCTLVVSPGVELPAGNASANFTIPPLPVTPAASVPTSNLSGSDFLGAVPVSGIPSFTG